MPEIRRLRYFLAVARELNFSRAAEQLHVAQPALSRQIRSLEQELGVELLVRTTHDVRLTEAGEYLLANGPRVVETTEELWRSVGTFGGGERGRIVFAFGTSGGYETAPRLLESVRSRLPGVQVITKVLPLQDILDGLGSGSLDIGMTRCATEVSEFEVSLVRQERQGVLLGGGHPLAEAAKVTLEQFGAEPILLHDRDANPGHYDAVMELYRRADLEPRVVRRQLVADLTYGPIVEGRAVSISGESVRDTLPETLRWIPLSPPVSFEVSLLARRHSRPAAVNAFLRAAAEAAAPLGWLDTAAGAGDAGSG